jgi:hypothetical protein
VSRTRTASCASPYSLAVSAFASRRRRSDSAIRAALRHTTAEKNTINASAKIAAPKPVS